MKRGAGAAGLLLALVAQPIVASSARAQGSDPPPTIAQTHFNQATQLFERGEIASACRVFEQSYAEAPAPGTLFNLAVCHEREGLSAKAYREFDELASRAEEQRLTDKAHAVRARATALTPKLGTLHLVHRADARADVTGLTLDNDTLPMDAWRHPVLVDPGVHTLVVQHADGVAVTRQVASVVAGQTVDVEMEDPAPKAGVAPPPVVSTRTDAAPPPRRPAQHLQLRTAAYVTGGIGAALLVGGTVAGVVAIIKKSKVNEVCPTNATCDPSKISQAKSDQSAGQTAAAFADIGLIAGGVAVATGVVLFFASRDAEPEGATATARLARPVVAPYADSHGGGLGISGHF